GVALAGEIAAAGLGAAVAPTAEAVAGGIRAMLAHPDRDALPGRARSFAAARYSVAAMGRALRLDYERMVAAARAARGGR
ncbi:MAG: hypothetical protein RQ752_14040, partial [Thermohalobaculum sp.]|nr:hypothetical protein [Thermohalobaculum sp.]